jgi:acyl-CoA synthetase (AMP-forming)/AMP-acid ligase II
MGGRTQIILPRFDLIAYLELTQKHHCNTGYIVPPILTALAKHPVIDKYDLSSLREDGLLCAAAPLSASLIDAVYARLKIPVFQAYGMTEASPATHILTLKNWEEGKGSVGPLVPNVEARIVDENGFDIKPGEAGEVWIRGPNIFLGYHNNVAATADCTATDGYYKTGDIAKVDLKTGFFYITDRIKELIKYKAYQVPPAELEGVLSGHPKIADVAVVGAWDAEAHTEVPRGFIVLQPGYQASKELETEICEWLEGRVAHYKRLRGGVRFVSEIPKNPSGKILRRVIKQQVAAEADAAKARL